MPDNVKLNTPVSEVMTANPATISTNSSIREAVDMFKEFSIDGLPVITPEKKVLGIITKSHVLCALKEGLDWEDPVDKIIARNIMCIDETTNVYDICTMPVKRLPVTDNLNEIVGMITKTDLIRIFSRDVRQVKERLTTIIESSPSGIVAVDGDKNIITLNPAAENILGVEASAVMGEPVEKHFLKASLLKVFETGCAGRGLNEIENGKTLLVNTAPIVKKDEVMGAVAFFEDLSELENISSQLNSYKIMSSKLRATIDSSFDGICVLTPTGQIEEINNAYKLLMGDDLEGQKKYFLDKLIGQIKISGKAVTIAQTTQTGRHVLITGNPVFGTQNELSMIVTNIRDITLLNSLKAELKETKELKEKYSRELSNLRDSTLGPEQIISNSPEMKKAAELASRVASFDSTVLLLGETGVGKELIAKLLHEKSSRSHGPFIKVNCAAIPEQLLESELFGYTPGAFTGANKKGKKGQFELAQEGTIFLDEIADLPLSLQAKLLRVLQEQEINKVGGTEPVKLNVRVITATNKNLEEMVEQGSFRQDLFYRLNVIPLQIPALRERREDIPSLAFIFLKKYNVQFCTEKKFTSAVLDCFMEYSWPGNVRELANITERLVVTSKEDLISEEDLPDFMIDGKRKGDSIRTNLEGPEDYQVGTAPLDVSVPLKSAVLDLEKKIIMKAIDKHGSIRKAARALKVDPSTLVRKMDRYNKSKAQ